MAQVSAIDVSRIGRIVAVPSSVGELSRLTKLGLLGIATEWHPEQDTVVIAVDDTVFVRIIEELREIEIRAIGREHRIARHSRELRLVSKLLRTFDRSTNANALGTDLVRKRDANVVAPAHDGNVGNPALIVREGESHDVCFLSLRIFFEGSIEEN